MAINFPGSPVNNQTFTSGGITWIYSTAIGAWKIVPNTIQGTTGVQGFQGIQGISNQGVQGIQGSQGLQGIQGLQGLSVQGSSGTTQGIQGIQGLQGLSIQGSSGTTQGIQGIQGTQGRQGVQGNTGFQGIQGALATATSINATAVTTDTKLVPVLVYSANTNQTAQTITSFTFNSNFSTFQLGTNTSTGSFTVLNGASLALRGIQIDTTETNRWYMGTDASSEAGSNAGTNLVIQNYADDGSAIGTVRPMTFYRSNSTVAIANLFASGLSTFTGGIAPAFTVLKQNSVGEGGEFYLQKSDTSTLSGNLVIDIVNNTFRIFESTGNNRGVFVDISAQGTQSALLTAANYNSYPPTNLSTTNGTWSTNGTIAAVVGQLAWKNYGNFHTIFDASASTSPAGSAVNNTNAQIPWTATYPTLMGWNTGNTFGVRVDSARLADNSTLSNGKRITVGTTAPGGPAVGDLWVDTN